MKKGISSQLRCRIQKVGRGFLTSVFQDHRVWVKFNSVNKSPDKRPQDFFKVYSYKWNCCVKRFVFQSDLLVYTSTKSVWGAPVAPHVTNTCFNFLPIWWNGSHCISLIIETGHLSLGCFSSVYSVFGPLFNWMIFLTAL